MSIGVMKAEFVPDRILEISDEMLEQNAKHFIHNFSGIPVIAPSEWDNEEYIKDLVKEDYDLMYSNPPCSGLSNINRNASASNEVNKYIYKFVDTVNIVKPKTFLMENAPTLISRGKIILNYLVSTLKDYNITVIRDYAGNHGVAMRRQRTLVIGTRKDILDGFLPIYPTIHRVNVADVLLEDEFSDLDSAPVYNLELVPERTCKDLEKYYDSVLPGDSIMTTLAKLSDNIILNLDISPNIKRQIFTLKDKMNNNKGAYEKSPSRLKLDEWSPSLASVMEFIHPIYNRPLYIREYARLMGYPDNFEFISDAKVPYIQAIAQGVPVNFAKWAAGQIKNYLDNPSDNISIMNNRSIRYLNICNYKNITAKVFTIDEFINIDNICK